ncbi:unnamed protein product, partial [Urochloa humidicola]
RTAAVDFESGGQPSLSRVSSPSPSRPGAVRTAAAPPFLLRLLRSPGACHRSSACAAASPLPTHAVALSADPSIPLASHIATCLGLPSLPLLAGVDGARHSRCDGKQSSSLPSALSLLIRSLASVCVDLNSEAALAPNPSATTDQNTAPRSATAHPPQSTDSSSS